MPGTPRRPPARRRRAAQLRAPRSAPPTARPEPLVARPQAGAGPALRLPSLPMLPALAGAPAGPSTNPCAGCDRCCQYVALQIDKPVDKADFEQIRWYVLHRGVSVYIDERRDWYIQFETKCDWLNDGACTHYELRPQLCRDYSVETCERYGDGPGYARLISNEAELEAYLDQRWRRRGGRRPAARRRAG